MVRSPPGIGVWNEGHKGVLGVFWDWDMGRFKGVTGLGLGVFVVLHDWDQGVVGVLSSGQEGFMSARCLT